MPDSRSRLEILVDVVNGRQAAGQLKDVGGAAQGMGQSADAAGGGVKGLAAGIGVALGGSVALKKGYGFLTDAADSATTLAKDTAALTRTTGMDAKSGSAWVSMAQNRGVATDTLTRSFTTFSQQLRGVEKGNKRATTAFADLGISADELKGLNTEDAIMAVADSMNALPAGADKAALAQQLFGRSARDLLPLLNQGSEGIAEQMNMMDRLGLVTDEKGVQQGLKLAAAQRELKGTMDGVKVQIGQALVPALVAAADAFLPLLQAFTWLIQNVPGMNIIIPILAGAIGGLLVAGVAAGALTALGVSLGTVGAILLSATGVGAVLVFIGVLMILYKRVGWFRDAVDAVIGFIVKNWPKIGLVLLALTGPVGLIIALFITFRGQIFDVVKAVIGKLGEIVSFIGGMPGKLGGIFSGMFKGLLSAAKSVVDSTIGVFTGFLDKITGIADKVKGVFDKVTGGVGGALSSISPFQHGGVVPGGGTLALVGEAGPELVQLPGGARVTPLQAGTAAPIDFSRFGGAIHVHLDVDGRELAHAVARDTAERAAAR